MTTKVNNSNKKAVSNDPRKELPGFSVTALPTPGTGCDIVSLSHSFRVCSPDMLVFWRTEKSASFLICHSCEVFSLGEGSGQIGICGLRPIHIQICGAAGPEQIRLLLETLYTLSYVAQIKEYMKTQALSKVQHSISTKGLYKMPTLRYNVLPVSSAGIFLTASKGICGVIRLSLCAREGCSLKRTQGII